MCLPEHLKIPQKKNSEIFLHKMIVPSLNEQLEKKNAWDIQWIEFKVKIKAEIQSTVIDTHET